MQHTILVTGANGQLGMELALLVSQYPAFHFVLTTRQDLPLDNFDLINKLIDKHQPKYVVNCAAYTAVDKAESDKELAHRINAEAPGVIAAACRRNNSKLIHISTDYVFNGNGQRPYKEDDPTDPVNYYGESKLLGEQQVMLQNPASIIIRTAWVYSQFGKNFVKTILRLVGEKEAINVVSDQYGTPTYAADLAETIMQIITVLDSETDPTGTSHAGIYHFSNNGIINWHEFALAIRDISGSKCKVNPIPASDYPTPARRPAYSVLDKSKISKEFNISIKPWRERLEACIKRIEK